MKSFILKTALYLSPFIALFTLLEIAYTHVPNEWSVKSDFIETSMDSIEAVILGPSVTLRGVNPEYIDMTTYNASMRGLDIEMDELVVKKIIKHSPNLKHIVVSVTFNDLHNNGRASRSPFMVYFDKYFGLKGWRTFIAQERGFNTLRKTMGYYFTGKTADDGIQPNGYRIFRRTSSGTFERKAQKLSKSLNNPHEEFVGMNTGYLESIISMCQSSNIRLTILTTPIHSSIVPYIQPTQIETVIRICSNLAKEHQGVYYLNWLRHEVYLDQHFDDPIHLNVEGATMMSKLLNQHLLLVSDN
jgi:hypothetical protein